MTRVLKVPEYVALAQPDAVLDLPLVLLGYGQVSGYDRSIGTRRDPGSPAARSRAECAIACTTGSSLPWPPWQEADQLQAHVLSGFCHGSH